LSGLRILALEGSRELIPVPFSKDSLRLFFLVCGVVSKRQHQSFVRFSPVRDNETLKDFPGERGKDDGKKW
jgi:hypothetical protein